MSEALPTYRLLDVGDERKLEQIGPYRVVRQAAQAYWPPATDVEGWNDVDGVYHRSRSGGGHWRFRKRLPSQWKIGFDSLVFEIQLTDFGHIGLFPEQADNWRWLRQTIAGMGSAEAPRVLNLFGYTGGSSLAAAQAGAQVTHVDASRGVVSWARENSAANGMAELPIRWIAEDVSKYVKRERTRGSTYHGFILDPPSFGRGTKGQVWKIESQLVPLLRDLQAIAEPLSFILLSCHTPGYTAWSLTNILHRAISLPIGEIEAGEMTIPVEASDLLLPAGTYARWAALP